MRRSIQTGLVLAAFCASIGLSFAAEAPPVAPTPVSAELAPATDSLPMVPPAKPGVFIATKKGADRYHLVVVGHKFTTRSDIEKYLAWRAANLTMEQKASWFTFVESRAKTDTAPVPKRDPAGLRYSFRMEYFRPVWRYRVRGTPASKSWSPLLALHSSPTTPRVSRISRSAPISCFTRARWTTPIPWHLRLEQYLIF